MSKFVITYTVGKYQLEKEINKCVDYDSKEQLEFDFELFIEENFMKNDVEFCGQKIEWNHFWHKDRIGNFHYQAPEFRTLEEWHEWKKKQ